MIWDNRGKGNLSTIRLCTSYYNRQKMYSRLLKQPSHYLPQRLGQHSYILFHYCQVTSASWCMHSPTTYLFVQKVCLGWWRKTNGFWCRGIQSTMSCILLFTFYGKYSLNISLNVTDVKKEFRLTLCAPRCDRGSCVWNKIAWYRIDKGRILMASGTWRCWFFFYEMWFKKQNMQHY